MKGGGNAGGTIRLDLLRLHGGSESMASLPTNLGIASEVSAEVERMLAARSDVEHILAFPRERAATQV